MARTRGGRVTEKKYYIFIWGLKDDGEQPCVFPLSGVSKRTKKGPCTSRADIIAMERKRQSARRRLLERGIDRSKRWKRPASHHSHTLLEPYLFSAWSIDQVGQWLKEIHCDDAVVALFRHHEVDGECLAQMTRDNIREVAGGSSIGYHIALRREQLCISQRQQQHALAGPSSFDEGLNVSMQGTLAPIAALLGPAHTQKVLPRVVVCRYRVPRDGVPITDRRPWSVIDMHHVRMRAPSISDRGDGCNVRVTLTWRSANFHSRGDSWLTDMLDEIAARFHYSPGVAATFIMLENQRTHMRVWDECSAIFWTPVTHVTFPVAFKKLVLFILCMAKREPFAKFERSIILQIIAHVSVMPYQNNPFMNFLLPTPGPAGE
jgi:hypothetical protein